MLKLSYYIDALELEIEKWDVGTVLFNPTFQSEKELEKLETPAIFILCDAIGEGEISLTGVGESTEPVEIDLVCVVSSSDDDADKKVFSLASFVKRKVLNNHWGLGEIVGNPKKITAQNTTGNQIGLKEWRVNFIQTIETDPLPPEPEYGFNALYLGINPKSDDDYKLIGEIDAT